MDPHNSIRIRLTATAMAPLFCLILSSALFTSGAFTPQDFPPSTEVLGTATASGTDPNYASNLFKESEGPGDQDGHCKARHFIGGSTMDVIWTRLAQRLVEDSGIKTGGGWRRNPGSSKRFTNYLKQVLMSPAAKNPITGLLSIAGDANKEQGYCLTIPSGGQDFYAVVRAGTPKAPTTSLKEGLKCKADSPYAKRSPVCAAGTAIDHTKYFIDDHAGMEKATAIKFYFRVTTAGTEGQAGTAKGILKTAFPVMACGNELNAGTATVVARFQETDVHTHLRAGEDQHAMEPSE